VQYNFHTTQENVADSRNIHLTQKIPDIFLASLNDGSHTLQGLKLAEDHIHFF
jgi:hypothetical protein